jgi:hypothetical protein
MTDPISASRTRTNLTMPVSRETSRPVVRVFLRSTYHARTKRHNLSCISRTWSAGLSNESMRASSRTLIVIALAIEKESEV